MAPAIRPDNVLAGLPDALRAELFAAARPVRLAAEQTLFTAGDPGDGCYLVDQGMLKITMISEAGSERILAILGPGALVGELSMIDGAPRSASVTALRDSDLRFLGRDRFDAFATGNPAVGRHVMEVLARRLRATNSVVAAASFLTMKGRVARALTSLADAFGHDVGSGRIVIRQKVTQHDIAAIEREAQL